MRKKRDYASLILLLASLAVFAFAAWKLFGIYTEYHQGTETYEELQDYVQKPEENVNPSPSEDGTSEEGTQNDGEGYLQVDFAGLKKVNPDVIAWIQIPALDISYRRSSQGINDSPTPFSALNYGLPALPMASISLS